MVLLSLAFFRRDQEKGDRQTRSKFWEIFSISLTVVLKITLRVLQSLEMFLNCAGRHRKRVITTVFTYSHQEPITRSVQLSYRVCEKAFSQVELFLN